jgi:hypothetical protein
MCGAHRAVGAREGNDDAESYRRDAGHDLHAQAGVARGRHSAERRHPALIDERNREEFAAPEMATVARKNGAGDAPERKNTVSEPMRKSQNGHG